MLNLLAGIVVMDLGVYLIGLVAVIAFAPLAARRFLMPFASSARAHYTAQVCCLVAGSATVMFSSSMWHADLARSFGWLIVVTAVALLLVPWRWHDPFGKWAVPMVVRRVRLFANGAFVPGAIALYGASRAVIH